MSGFISIVLAWIKQPQPRIVGNVGIATLYVGFWFLLGSLLGIAAAEPKPSKEKHDTSRLLALLLALDLCHRALEPVHQF